MDEDLRHESYREHDIKSVPVSVDLPGSDNTWQVRIEITSPQGVIHDRLLENPYYKNKADALDAGLQWGRDIINGEIDTHASA